MRILTIAMMTIGFSSPGWAQLTPERVIANQQIPELRLSPDGGRLAFLVQSGPILGDGPPPSGNFQSLWLADTKTGSLTKLLDDASAHAIRWSADGKHIGYVSSTAGAPQVYGISASGGAAVKLTEHRGGVFDFEWSTDGRQLAFLALDTQDGPADADPAGEDSRIKQLAQRIRVVSGDDTPMHAWVFDVKTGVETLVTSGVFDVQSVAWKASNDGLVLVASPRPDPEHWTHKIYSMGLSANAKPKMIIDPSGPVGDLKVAPDGRSIAYVASPQGRSAIPTDLFIASIDGSGPRDVTANIDRTVRHFVWKDSTTLAVQVESGFVNQLFSITVAGRITPETSLDPHSGLFDVSRQGQFAYVRGTAHELPEVWTSHGNQPAVQLTHVNDDWKGTELATAEMIRYRSFDGTEIEGLLLKPAHAPQKLPTVVLIHGGPVGRWADVYDPEGQLLASHGYAVFYPNIRGASSYGIRLMEMIRSTARGGSGWATGPLRDVIAGVDELIRSGAADPDRLAICGWSYGGYMTALALTRTNRFKVGIAGAGFYDMLNDLGTEIAGYVPGDEWMYGDFFSPDTQQALAEDSPISTVKNLHAPLLLMHGEFDDVDTIGQAYEFYRAAQRQNVPLEFVLYPGEGHGLRTQEHMVDRLNRTVAWLEKYLK